MTNPIVDCTIKEAQEYLIQDFSKEVIRTKYLYLEIPIPKEIGDGFFEPILIFVCWCDSLGALYTGDAKRGRSTKRSKIFMKDILGEVNNRYKDEGVTDDLLEDYRHLLVHFFQPKNFLIAKSDIDHHLTKKDGKLNIGIKQLLNEMLEGIKLFAKVLDPDIENNSYGSLRAFNKARKERGHES